jgi:hypothetical protein
MVELGGQSGKCTDGGIPILLKELLSDQDLA